MAALPYSNGEVVISLNFTSANAAGTTAATPVASTPLGLSRFDAISIEATVQGATGGTLDIYLQVSHDFNPSDGSGNWFDYIHFAQLAAAASAVNYRVDPALTNSVTTVGKNLSPALAAGVCAGGYWGDAMRVVQVAGGGTSAGAAQVITLIGKLRMRP